MAALSGLSENVQRFYVWPFPASFLEKLAGVLIEANISLFRHQIRRHIHGQGMVCPFGSHFPNAGRVHLNFAKLYSSGSLYRCTYRASNDSIHFSLVLFFVEMVVNPITGSLLHAQSPFMYSHFVFLSFHVYFPTIFRITFEVKPFYMRIKNDHKTAESYCKAKMTHLFLLSISSVVCDV